MLTILARAATGCFGASLRVRGRGQDRTQAPQFRAIGPANMMGRTTALEGVPGDPNVIYVGIMAGGIWKASSGDVASELVNPDVVNAGTEMGLHVSATGGIDGFRLGANQPPVPVHEVLAHMRENDVIVATDGRCSFILDDASVIQDLATAMNKGSPRNSLFREPKPVYGAIIRYSLRGSTPPRGLAATMHGASVSR